MIEPRQVFRADGYSVEPGDSAAPAFCPRCGVQIDDPDDECPGCGHREYRNAAPAVSVLVADGDRVLLCRRSAPSFRGGLWCLPCGYIDYDEDFLTAGRREVNEETGLDVEITSILSVVTNYHTPALHTLVIVLEATVVGGHVVAGDDADAADWFPRSDLPELAFAADQHIIERYDDRRGFGAPVDPRHARRDLPEVADG